MRAGTLYGVGVGPGDPELITLKGLRLLQRARRVFLPATAPGHSYAGSIVSCYLDAARQRIVELVCPPFRDRSALVGRWTELAHEVAAALAGGDEGVFVTEGDPSLYSTFQYLRSALERHHPEVPVAVVPGVPSFCAAAAVADVPLAMWDERLAVVPGTTPAETLTAALADYGTVALLKPGRAVPVLADALSAGASELTLVRRAGRPEQAIFCGEEALREAAGDYFSLLIARARPSNE